MAEDSETFHPYIGVPSMHDGPELIDTLTHGLKVLQEKAGNPITHLDICIKKPAPAKRQAIEQWAAANHLEIAFHPRKEADRRMRIQAERFRQEREDMGMTAYHQAQTEAMEEVFANHNAVRAIYERNPAVQEALAFVNGPGSWQKQDMVVPIPKGLQEAFEFLRAKGAIEGPYQDFAEWLGNEIGLMTQNLMMEIENIHCAVPEYNALWNQACAEAGCPDERYTLPRDEVPF